MSREPEWYRKQKKRVRKKYTLFLGRYLTPREVRVHFKRKELTPEKINN